VLGPWYKPVNFGVRRSKNRHAGAPPIENLLVRIHFIIEMIRWTGIAPWEFEFPFCRLNDYSKVDVPGFWYKPVNFESLASKGEEGPPGRGATRTA
jgi:hypothetical protein